MLGRFAHHLLVLLSFVAGVVAQQRILPLGDSITESITGYAGYRYYLWKEIDNGGFCADFVGIRTGVAGGSPLHPDFDQQHDGFSGASAVGVALASRLVPSCVPAADIALIHLGTNDILLPLLAGRQPTLDAALAAMVQIVGVLRARNPAVKIAVAQVMPIDPAAPVATTAHLWVPIWNQRYLPQLLALSTAASPLVLVDQNSMFRTPWHLRDSVHPNDRGERLLARNWLGALVRQGWLVPGAPCVATLGPGCLDPTIHGVPPTLDLAGGAPSPGASLVMRLRGAPSNALAAAVVLGATIVPCGLGACSLYPSMDVLLWPRVVMTNGRDGTFDLAFPSRAPAGCHFYAQGVTFGVAAGDVATSNGLQFTLN